MTKIRGIVEYFEDQEDFDFFQIKVKTFDNEVIIIEGNFEGLFDGELIEAEVSGPVGERGDKPVFECSHIRVSNPTTDIELKAFLSGGLFPKIGEKRAETIVSQGLCSDNYISYLPNIIEGMRGLSQPNIEAIKSALQVHTLTVKLDDFLADHGLYTSGFRIANKLGIKSLSTICANPFTLGIEFEYSFNECRTLAKSLKAVAPLSVSFNDIALCAVICYMRKAMNGSTWIAKERIVETIERTIPSICDIAMPPEGWTFEKCIQKGINEKRITIENERVYFSETYKLERFCAKKIKDIIISGGHNKDSFFNPAYSSKTLAKEQARAIQGILEEQISIITGGPGTGKTTTIGEACISLEKAGYRVGLAAPTGKAANRLSVASQREAMTIHRLISAGKIDFSNAPVKLFNTIIVDESSMIDLKLLYLFLSRIKPGTKIVFVGDFDQLPSVEAGNIFKDLIESGVIPVFELTENHRLKAMNSSLQMLIDDIRFGVVKEPEDYNDESFKYICVKSPDDAMKEMLETVANLKETKGSRAVKVLSPYFTAKSKYGCEIINPKLKSVWNPENSLTDFTPGDIVMNTSNNKKKGIFNGDMGYVIKADSEEKKIDVIFGENSNRRTISLGEDDMGRIILAYAMTVHKSQGSEYPVIVLVIPHGSKMLNKNLLYTAISRAQEKVIIIGSWIDFQEASSLVDARNTSLAEKIREEMGLDHKRISFEPTKPARQLEFDFEI